MHVRPLTRALLGTGLASALLALAACGGGSSEDALAGDEAESGTIVVGSANFPESELLMEMYAQVLEAEDLEVERRPSIGAREAYLPALESGEINLFPEYSGALLAYFDADTEATSPEDVMTSLEENLPEDLALLAPAEAENKSVLVVTEETADEYDLASLEDLVPVGGELTLGGAPEFETRRAGLVGLADVYGIEFGGFRALDPGGPLTKTALQEGTIDVGNLFSTDSAIVNDGYVELEDPAPLFQAQQIIPVLQESAVTDEVQSALDDFSAVLTTENLTEALAQVVDERRNSAEVATEFLEDNDLL